MKEKIQKSEALLDFISRRLEETKIEWDNVQELNKQPFSTKDIPLERTLHGKYFAFKEIHDGLRNNYFNGTYNTLHPNQSVRRLRAIQQRDIELKFWKDKCKYLAPNLIDGYYKEVDELLKKDGYLL